MKFKCQNFPSFSIGYFFLVSHKGWQWTSVILSWLGIGRLSFKAPLLLSSGMWRGRYPPCDFRLPIDKNNVTGNNENSSCLIAPENMCWSLCWHLCTQFLQGRGAIGEYILWNQIPWGKNLVLLLFKCISLDPGLFICKMGIKKKYLAPKIVARIKQIHIKTSRICPAHTKGYKCIC